VGGRDISIEAVWSSWSIGYDAVISEVRRFTRMTRAGGSSLLVLGSWALDHVSTAERMLDMTSGEMNLAVQDSTLITFWRDLHSIHQVLSREER